MNVTINIVELSSELATDKLFDNWSESIKIYKNDEANTLEYTEEAQDIFNELYDYYYSMIERLSTNQ